jgi:hypothetical protein
MGGSFMGERARAIGTEAENKAWKFLENLGYKIDEKNNEQYDIDGLGAFLPKIKGGFTRPRYAPDGFTAFEVTEEALRKTKVTDFRKKIQRYNANHSQKIKGGVLLVDQKISPTMIDFMKNRHVWGWGNSRHSLYKAKIKLFNEWREIGRTSEIALDESTSFLRCATPPPTTYDRLLRFGVFLDDDFTKLSLRKILEIVEKIKANSISPLMNIEVSPLNVSFVFHSVGGVSISEAEFEEHVAKAWRVYEINIMGKSVFEDYRTFPSM